MSPKAYLAILFSVSLIVLGTIAAFNWKVDPFFVFDNNTTGVYAKVERQFKTRQVYIFPHDEILMGSSVTAHINPNGFPEHRLFNAAFNGALIEEILSFTRKHIRNQKLFILALDLYMFNEGSFPVKSADEPLFDDNTLSHTISLSALTQSFKDLSSKASGAPPYAWANGARNTDEKDKRDKEMGQIDDAALLKSVGNSYYGNFTYSDKRLDFLRELKALLDERGIRYTVVLNPINKKLLGLIHLSPKIQDGLTRMQKDVRNIFQGTIDLSEQPYSDPTLFYANDPFHYKPKMGDLVLAEVYKLVQ